MSRGGHAPKLQVAINGRLVGSLEQQLQGPPCFSYDRSWIDQQERAIPISLALPVRAERYTGDALRAVLENLLPDDRATRQRIAENLGSAEDDTFALLQQIGADCMGALQFSAAGTKLTPPGPATGFPLNEARIAALLRDLPLFPLGIRQDSDLTLRATLSGTHDRTALLWHQGQWCAPQEESPSTHILKPARGRLRNGIDLTDSVENEHFCLTICRELGLETVNHEIVQFDDQRALAVTRWDRLDAQDGRLLRIPQENLCQALGVRPARKYESEGGPGIRDCLRLLSASDTPEPDRRSMLTAQVLFWLIGACDGHAQNFHLFLSPGGRSRLAPIQDVLSLQPSYEAHEVDELNSAMAAGNRRNYRQARITPEDFVEDAVAARMAARTARDILGQIGEAAAPALERAASSMPPGFPDRVIESIEHSLRSRATMLLGL